MKQFTWSWELSGSGCSWRTSIYGRGATWRCHLAEHPMLVTEWLKGHIAVTITSKHRYTIDIYRDDIPSIPASIIKSSWCFNITDVCFTIWRCLTGVGLICEYQLMIWRFFNDKWGPSTWCWRRWWYQVLGVGWSQWKSHQELGDPSWSSESTGSILGDMLRGSGCWMISGNVAMNETGMPTKSHC